MRIRADADAMLAALPLAAAGALVLASWLPVRFAYHENTLGIVSLATLRRYPLQQETFWLAFAALAFGLLAWALARALRAADAPPGSQATAFAFSVSGLLLALWLPSLAGALACAAAAVAAFGVLRRAPPLAGAPAPVAPDAPLPRTGLGRRLLLVAVAVLVALPLTPGIWMAIWNVWFATPDVQLVADHFNFHAEIGQHLAWADAIRRGGLHGRDFFCLYGPLHEFGLVALWELTRRSIGTYRLYLSGGRAVGYAIAILLCAALLRRKSLVLLLPLLLPYVDLRMGLPLAGLLLFADWLKRRSLGLVLAAGIATGASLLYSQEFGLALLLSATAGLAVLRDGRGAAAFAAGALAVVVPVLGWFAAQGALVPMLSDAVAYPSYLLAGYAKLPFPSLLASLPLRLAELREPDGVLLRLGYSAPLICAAALLLAAPVASLSLRHPIAWLREAAETLARDPLRLACALLALFGLISFRSALGRSDLIHVLMILAPPALLVVIGIDRLLGSWLAEPARRGLVATRAVALVLFILLSGLLEKATPVLSTRLSWAFLEKLASGDYAPRGDRHVQQVWRWVLLHTEPDEPVLFLPDYASYYYLTRRPSPIRFMLGHQIVTDAHRAEVLRDLRARPPRYVVWDDGLMPVDGIEPRLFLGAPLYDWIGSAYTEETRIGTARVLRRRDPGG